MPNIDYFVKKEAPIASSSSTIRIYSVLEQSTSPANAMVPPTADRVHTPSAPTRNNPSLRNSVIAQIHALPNPPNNEPRLMFEYNTDYNANRRIQHM